MQVGRGKWRSKEIQMGKGQPPAASRQAATTAVAAAVVAAATATMYG